MDKTMMNHDVLVSVIVLSYHSEPYILETLESVYRQTYGPLELIVADDGSTDRTAEVARAWIAEKKDRFVNCVVRVNEVNQGIPGNLNSAIRMAQGKYIKTIAADDLLRPDCIEVNTRTCEEKGYQHLCTWLVKFMDTDQGRKTWIEEPCRSFFEASAQRQNWMLLRKNYVYGSIFFFRKDYLEALGLYDERYRMLEDYPMWMKITAHGDQLHLLEHPTVEYRISQSSISNSAGQRVVNVNYFKCYRQFFYDVLFRELIRKRRFVALLLHWRDFIYRWLVIWLGNDRSKGAVRVVEYFHQRKYLHGKH